MELREALMQISEIRSQMARTEVFRGYRALPVAFSGLVALVTAACQHVWLPDPTHNIYPYLALWLGAAAISAVATGTEMVLRDRRGQSALRREVTWLAVEQFLPCIGAGGLLMIVLLFCAHDNNHDSMWMLPGLWQILFSLGIFASYRLLPKATYWVAMFYLAAGIATLALARGGAALSPWAMGLPFGVGQFLGAAVLYWTLERNDVEAKE